MGLNFSMNLQRKAIYMYIRNMKKDLIHLNTRLSNRRGWVGRGSWVVGHGSWVVGRGYTSCIHTFMLFQMPSRNSGFVCDLF